MQRFVPVLICLVSLLLAGLLSGCDDDTVAGLSRAIGQKLSVGVLLESGDDDACLYRQLAKLKADYEALTPASRKIAAGRAASLFKQVVLKRTVRSQVIAGEAITLVYVTQSCSNNGCWYNRVASKMIGGERKVEGTEPATQLIKGETLTLTPQSGRDESLRRVYYTRSVTTYDRSESADGRPFIEGRQRGTIFLHDEDATPERFCGRVASLAELIGGEGLVEDPRSGN